MATTAPREGEVLALGKEWNEARRAELVSQIASARLTVGEACARYGLGAELVQDWLRNFRRSAVSAFDDELKRTLVDQGADVAVGSAEFAGTLEEISVIDWIQSVEVTRKSAVIVVTGNGLESTGSESSASESRIWCASGAIIDAESARLRGEPALHRIVSFEHGRVWVEFCAARRERTIYGSTPSLLLEAAHRKDEAARMWLELGDGRCAYRITERAGQRPLRSSQAERRLLECFQQPSSLRQVFQQSELGDVETLTLLTQLIESQLIVADPSSTPAPASEGDTGSFAASARTLAVARASRPPELARRSPPRRFSRGWAWSCVAALALVSAVAWLRHRSPAAPRSVAEVVVAALRPAPRPAPEAPRYAVATTFEPANAAVWLDGQRLPSGALNTTFPKDGHAHELRVVAPGHASSVVVFADTAPPRRIRLETLPAPPATVSVDNAPADVGDVENMAPGQAEVVHRGAKAARPNARRSQRARRQERATKPPSIQKIDAATPAIRVIP
jgi:transposase-like protein